jgi:hypothetical protein
VTAKLVRIALVEDEARTLEIELGAVIRRLRERTAVAPSAGADQLIDRFLSIVAKVRSARGLDKPDPKRKARDGYRSYEKAEA